MRSCLFCSAHRLTKEHIWPDWIVRLFPIADYTVSTSNGMKGLKTNRRQNSIELQYRSVCKACNTGWMSRIEDTSKPILLPFILGNQPRLIPSSSQFTIARWLTLRSMIFDSYSSKNESKGRYFTEAERSRFMVDKEPLNNARIWIAALDKSWDGAVFSYQSSIALEKDIGIKVLTCAIGHTAFQMFHAKGSNPAIVLTDGSRDLDNLSSPPWRGIAAQIWPRRIVNRWPLDRLPADEFQVFVHRFGFDFRLH